MNECASAYFIRARVHTCTRSHIVQMVLINHVAQWPDEEICDRSPSNSPKLLINFQHLCNQCKANECLLVCARVLEAVGAFRRWARPVCSLLLSEFGFLHFGLDRFATMNRCGASMPFRVPKAPLRSMLGTVFEKSCIPGRMTHL